MIATRASVISSLVRALAPIALVSLSGAAQAIGEGYNAFLQWNTGEPGAETIVEAKGGTLEFTGGQRVGFEDNFAGPEVLPDVTSSSLNSVILSENLEGCGSGCEQITFRMEANPASGANTLFTGNTIDNGDVVYLDFLGQDSAPSLPTNLATIADTISLRIEYLSGPDLVDPAFEVDVSVNEISGFFSRFRANAAIFNNATAVTFSYEARYAVKDEPPRSQPTRAELAALIRILSSSLVQADVALPDLSGVDPELIFFPGTGPLAGSTFDDGTILTVRGEIPEDGGATTISSISIRPGGDPLSEVRAELDAVGRPTIIRSALGQTTFTYGSGIVTVTTTTAGGDSVTRTAPYSTAQLSVSAARESCDINSLFTRRVVRGTLVFACDNKYIEDVRSQSPGYDPQTDSEFSSQPLSLSVNLLAPDEELGSSYNSELGVLDLRLNPLPGNNPSRSRHTYDFATTIRQYNAPTFPEWEKCCRNASGDAFIQLGQLDETLKSVTGRTAGELSDIASYARCSFEVLSTGGTVAPTCLQLIQSYFIGLFIDEVRKELSCGQDDYNRSLEKFGPQSAYRNALVEVRKYADSNDEDFFGNDVANFRKSPVDFTANVNRLPTLTVGPMSPGFEPGSTIEPIRAYRANGDVIPSSNGRLDNNFVIPAGEHVYFRAFDHFFNRSCQNEAGNTICTDPFAEASREANQYYGCANYFWTLRKDGQVVSGFPAAQSAGTDRLSTEGLEEGSYELKLTINGITDPALVGADFIRQVPAGSDSVTATLKFEVEPVLECWTSFLTNSVWTVSCNQNGIFKYRESLWFDTTTFQNFGIQPEQGFLELESFPSEFPTIDEAGYFKEGLQYWDASWYLFPSEPYDEQAGTYPLIMEEDVPRRQIRAKATELFLRDPSDGIVRKGPGDSIERYIDPQENVFASGTFFTTYGDSKNFTQLQHTCNYQNGSFSRGTRYDRTSNNGVVSTDSTTLSSDDDCLRPSSEIDAVNPLQLEDSIIYRCLTDEGAAGSGCSPVQD